MGLESSNLETGLNKLAGQGHSLNPYEVTMLKAQLAKLQCDEKFGRIHFWGKIFGGAADYYVAYGQRDTEAEFPAKQFYYASGETFEFADLPVLSEEDAAVIGTFASDAAFTGELDFQLFPATEGGEDADAADARKETFTELHRLSHTVASIDGATAVVPNGAYILDHRHQTCANPSFAGLGYGDLGNLDSFCHFRPSSDSSKNRALAESDVDYSTSSFLDKLGANDVKGAWSIRRESSAGSCHVRSLVWPGYCSYAVAGKPEFGGMYIGHGIKNKDLPFML